MDAFWKDSASAAVVLFFFFGSFECLPARVIDKILWVWIVGASIMHDHTYGR